MDKYFDIFPISTLAATSNIKNYINIIDYLLGMSINFKFEIPNNEETEKKITLLRSIACDINVEYDKNKSIIEINCINIPHTIFITRFNEIIKKVLNIIILDNNTQIFINIDNYSNRKYYKTNYETIKYFQIPVKIE